MTKTWRCNQCEKRFLSEMPPGDCACGCRLFSEEIAWEGTAPPPAPPARAARGGWRLVGITGFFIGFVLGGTGIYAIGQHQVSNRLADAEKNFNAERVEFKKAIADAEAQKKKQSQHLRDLSEGKAELERVLGAATEYEKEQDQNIKMLLNQKDTLEKELNAAIKHGKMQNEKLKTVTSEKSELQSELENLKNSLPVLQEPLKQDPYLVIDLSGGANAAHYPVTYLDAPPPDGWPDEYRGERLVLRRIEPGTFMMGSPPSEPGRGADETRHEVTLTQPFYIGIFEITQKQWQLVTGGDPASNKGEFRPVEMVSYDDIQRFFIAKIRAKTEIDFGLPSEAQWEYACRAGSNAIRSGDMNQVGRYNANHFEGRGGSASGHTKVGSYLPNKWGLYDMHGNVWEWCRDWYSGDLGPGGVSDPKGAPEGEKRLCRGGSCLSDAKSCRSACRAPFLSGYRSEQHGFRLFSLGGVR